eukprot:TRINITY_DN3140_c0_g1_i10.p1 TRINITY_DN3140_c0_g1~~TRINITY_DN3140_c0_g1_i10.p1  ORF type:complete len:165 (+),score=48.48 TRINITY_DN3140_c0_g1_i10:307-801(+)
MYTFRNDSSSLLVEDMDKEKVGELEKQVNELKEEEGKLKKLVSHQQTINNQLAQTPTNDNLSNELEKARGEVDLLRTRLEGLKSNQKVVDPNQKAKLEKTYVQVRKEWVNRKRKFRDICDTFEENGALDAKKLKKLKEELGIETDEMAGVSTDPSETKFAKLTK